MSMATRIMGLVAGLLMSAGSVCAWRFWGIDGELAFIFAASGGYMVWHCIETEAE
jgi:hypothetical protein